MVHRMVEAMSQLQKEKAQLQEELVVLREKLALHDSDQQATSTQLQNQVPGEVGMGRDHCPLWSSWRTLWGHLDSTRPMAW